LLLFTATLFIVTTDTTIFTTIANPNFYKVTKIATYKDVFTISERNINKTKYKKL